MEGDKVGQIYFQLRINPAHPRDQGYQRVFEGESLSDKFIGARPTDEFEISFNNGFTSFRKVVKGLAELVAVVRETMKPNVDALKHLEKTSAESKKKTREVYRQALSTKISAFEASLAELYKERKQHDAKE